MKINWKRYIEDIVCIILYLFVSEVILITFYYWLMK